jgi:hypothetical protein
MGQWRLGISRSKASTTASAGHTVAWSRPSLVIVMVVAASSA